MTNRSRHDLERRILAVSKNYGHRKTEERERSMRRILKDMGDAPASVLSNDDCANLVTMMVAHWPQGSQAPTIPALTGQLANLRAGRARWEAMQREAAQGMSRPPDQLPPPDPAYTGATGRIRKGTNHSVYLRNEVAEWFAAQCPPAERGKAEVSRGMHAVFEALRPFPGLLAPDSIGAFLKRMLAVQHQPQCPGSAHAVDNLPEDPKLDPIAAINFALTGNDYECAEFLRLWREGCWQEIAEQFPKFELPDSIAKLLVPAELPEATFDPLNDD